MSNTYQNLSVIALGIISVMAGGIVFYAKAMEDKVVQMNDKIQQNQVTISQLEKEVSSQSGRLKDQAKTIDKQKETINSQQGTISDKNDEISEKTKESKKYQAVGEYFAANFIVTSQCLKSIVGLPNAPDSNSSEAQSTCYAAAKVINEVERIIQENNLST